MNDAPLLEPNQVAPVYRLYFQTYLQMVRNAVGTDLFRNFYVRAEDGHEFDALDDGDNSCAFFVSSILTLLKKLHGGVHGTVEATVKDLRESGWQEVDIIEPGDVLVWEPLSDDSGSQYHIGFALGNERAISNASSQKSPQEHDIHFGDAQRKVQLIFRYDTWD